MDENLEKPKEEISEESQAAEAEQPKLREISKEELILILEDHQKYHESEGKEENNSYEITSLSI